MEKTTETYQYTKLSYFMLGFLIVAAFFGIVGGIDLVASAESETSKVLGWLAIVIFLVQAGYASWIVHEQMGGKAVHSVRTTDTDNNDKDAGAEMRKPRGGLYSQEPHYFDGDHYDYL